MPEQNLNVRKCHGCGKERWCQPIRTETAIYIQPTFNLPVLSKDAKQRVMITRDQSLCNECLTKKMKELR